MRDDSGREVRFCGFCGRGLNTYQSEQFLWAQCPKFKWSGGQPHDRIAVHDVAETYDRTTGVRIKQ